MSEALILPFVFLFLYIAALIVDRKLEGWKAVFYLSLSLIILYNIRYSALFIIGGTGLYGLIFWKRKYGRTFILSAAIGMIFIVLYKFLFIDYFNKDYVQDFLEMGLHTTPELLVELFQGLSTSFNPFIHMANPAGGIINYGIYGIGVLNILFMIFLFVRQKLSDSEFFYVFIGVFGIVCSYFIQYFYSITPIDYRLIAPFSFPLWLVYFKKLFEIFNTKVYIIGILSLMSGMLFTWLSKGNYLENRKTITEFLKSENLDKVPLKFFIIEEKDLEKVQLADIISTVNPQVSITLKPQDTLKKTTLTRYKVLQKVKIDKNKYQ